MPQVQNEIAVRESKAQGKADSKVHRDTHAQRDTQRQRSKDQGEKPRQLQKHKD